MSIESEVFKRYKISTDKLISYGFKLDNGIYKYSKFFLSGSFRADIEIDNNLNITGKVIERALDEEYTNFRVESISGDFANSVKENYIAILNDIANICFDRQNFILAQTNRISKKICEKYSVKAEYLWDAYPNFAVYRNIRSKKWFSIIMNVDKGKIVKGQSGEIEVINVKLDEKVPEYIKVDGIYSAYHLSKKNWISIILDDTLDDDYILKLIDISFNKSDLTNKWIVPANPNYYPIESAFDCDDEILWKQSSNILVGDIVYMYVSQPIFAILYKTMATQTDIEYNYSDNNVSMDTVMRLKLLKRYTKDELQLKLLKDNGLKSIQGPHRVNDQLQMLLDKHDN